MLDSKTLATSFSVAKEAPDRNSRFFLVGRFFVYSVMVRLKYFSDSTISRGSIGLFFSILIFTSYFTAPNIRFHVVYSAASAKLSNTSLSIMNRTKTVLMTSRSFWGFRFQEGRHGFINAGCEINNCILTKNHSYLPDYAFDAFLVHMPTQRKGPWILPNRKNYQIFIFFSTEPPGNLLLHSTQIRFFFSKSPEENE